MHIYVWVDNHNIYLWMLDTNESNKLLIFCSRIHEKILWLCSLVNWSETCLLKLMQRVRPPSKSSENMERGAYFDFVTFKGRLILMSKFLGWAFPSRRLFQWNLFSFSLPIKLNPKLKFTKRFSESKSYLRIKVHSQSWWPVPKSKFNPKD